MKASPGFVIGTPYANTLEKKLHWAANGGTHVLVSVPWSSAQPKQGGPINVAAALAEIKDAETAGLRVFLQLAFHYAPTWATGDQNPRAGAIPPFVNQYGESWRASGASGTNIRDWFFTSTGRALVEQFVSGALEQFDLSTIAAIRVGGGSTGEVRWPSYYGLNPGIHRKHVAQWAYGPAPQSGTGLATTGPGAMTVCPVPGYIYASGNTGNDTAFANWYLAALGRVAEWQVGIHRSAGWYGPIYVLMGGDGMREGLAPRSARFIKAMSGEGDFGIIMDHFQDDPLARPQCTWLNQADWAADITNEGNKAPWRIILEGAQERGMAAQIMGETGGGGYTTNPDMAYVFGVPVPAGYRGVWWFDYNTLTGGAGSNATLSHLKTFSMDVLPR